MSDHAGPPDDLSETETLARLTIEEKRRIARAAILDFPHLSHGLLADWLRAYGAGPVPAEAPLVEKTDALLDRCETLVRSGETPEALDQFIYGYLYPANLESQGIDPDVVADREPLARWKGVYENQWGGNCQHRF